MKDNELNQILNSLHTPKCDANLADRIISKSATVAQDKPFFAKIWDAIHSKYVKYSLVPVAACVAFAFYIYTPGMNDIDMLEYAEIFLVENGME